MKNVLIIAGGIWQMPIINFFKNKRYKVFVVDPYDFSEGSKAADVHIKCDVRSVEEVMEKIEGISFDIITSDQSDIAVPMVAKLAEKLKLKGNSIEATSHFTNKFFMRNLANKLKLPIPAYGKASNILDLDNFIDKHQLPVIIKPADSQSSRGVYKMDEDNRTEAAVLVAQSLAFSNCGYLVVEKFVPGIELTVEGFASGGKHRTLAISSKKHFRTAIASSLEYPPVNIPESILKEVTRVNDAFVENSGLAFGITHAEYMVVPETGQINLIEIACRGGGSLISSNIVDWVAGVNMYEMLYTCLTGGVVDVKNLQISKRNAMLHFFEFGAGKVKAIHGIDKVKAMEGIETVRLFFKEGDVLQNATDDRSRPGMVIVFANSKAELDKRLVDVKNTLKIEFYE
jgi:biotin carboxylase